MKKTFIKRIYRKFVRISNKIKKRYPLKIDKSIFSTLKHQEKVLKFLPKLHPISTEYSLIRIGSNNDGGYLVPNCLEDIKAVFSPGVSDVADFEEYFAIKGIPCFLADYSVKAPPIKHPHIHFEKKYLGVKNKDKFITLDNWVHEKELEGNLLLQIDIEGAEYDVLNHTSDSTLNRFKIIVLELHQLERWADPHKSFKIEKLFKKLLKSFSVVHLHVNNCAPIYTFDKVEIPSVIELTLLRKSDYKSSKPISNLPHRLDSINCQEYKDLLLPNYWYQ